MTWILTVSVAVKVPPRVRKDSLNFGSIDKILIGQIQVLTSRLTPSFNVLYLNGIRARLGIGRDFPLTGICDILGLFSGYRAFGSDGRQ